MIHIMFKTGFQYAIKGLEGGLFLVIAAMVETTRKKFVHFLLALLAENHAAAERGENELAKFVVSHFATGESVETEVFGQQPVIIERENCRESFLLCKIARCPQDNNR